MFRVMFCVCAAVAAQLGGVAAAQQATASLEGLYLFMADSNDIMLTAADNPSFDFVAISTADLDVNGAPGGRLTVEAPAFGETLRFSAMGFGAFGDQRSFTGLEDATTPRNTSLVFIDDFNPGADVSATSDSELIEVLIVSRDMLLLSGDIAFSTKLYEAERSDVNLFVGPQVLYFEDDLRTLTYDDANDVAGTDNDLTDGDVRVRNRLAGLQLGVSGDLYSGGGVTLGGMLRGGLMANFVGVDTRYLERDDPDLLEKSFDDVGFAQYVEFSPRIGVAVSDSVELGLTGELLWINGISAAGDHFAGITDADLTSIDADKDQLFYGGGLELRIKLN